jgi:hypothetical protein
MKNISTYPIETGVFREIITSEDADFIASHGAQACKNIPKGFFQSLDGLRKLNRDSNFDQCTKNESLSSQINQKSNSLSDTCNSLYKDLDNKCPATTGVLQETASNSVNGQPVSDSLGI